MSGSSSVTNKKRITSHIHRKNFRQNQGAATAGVRHTHSRSFEHNLMRNRHTENIKQAFFSPPQFCSSLLNDFQINWCVVVDSQVHTGVLPEEPQVWRITSIKYMFHFTNCSDLFTVTNPAGSHRPRASEAAVQSSGSSNTNHNLLLGIQKLSYCSWKTEGESTDTQTEVVLVFKPQCRYSIFTSTSFLL